MCLRIAAALELEPGQVLAAIAAERAKPVEVKLAWSKVASQLAKVACLAGLVGGLHNQNVRASAELEPEYTYQPKPPRRLARWAAGGLSAWCRALGLSLALAGQAHAGDWTVYDTAREAGFMALLTADCLQTRYGIEHPGQFREGNRLVAGGSDEPSKGRLNNICIGTALGHYGISRWFSPDSRKLWQLWQSFTIVHHCSPFSSRSTRSPTTRPQA